MYKSFFFLIIIIIIIIVINLVCLVFTRLLTCENNKLAEVRRCKVEVVAKQSPYLSRCHLTSHPPSFSMQAHAYHSNRPRVPESLLFQNFAA